MVREEELIQKAKEVRESLIEMAADEIDATHIEIGQIKAKDDTRKLLTVRVAGANRYVPYQGHDTSEFTVGDYWAIIFDDYGTIRLGWWTSNNAGGGTIPTGPHASTHEDGGADEISVAALSGLLADDQHVLDAEVLLVAAALVHAARHENGGADEISVAALSGLLVDDQHVLDAEVLAIAAALVHAARHQNGGADEISVAALSGVLADKQDANKLQGRAVEVAAPGAADVLTWNAIATEWQAQAGAAPGAHAASHEDGGADEISVAALSGLLADDQHVLDAEVLAVAAPLVHKARHVSGGADAFANTDLLEAIIKRIQVTGPVTLTLGAVADGENLRRVGATVVGAAPAGAGAWTLIEDVELGAPAATIDFQNIPGTYKYLAILYSARSARDGAEDVDVMGIRFNNDSGNNYDWARHRGGSTHQAETGFANAEIQSPLIPAGQSEANSFGSGNIYIYDYTSTDKKKGTNIVNGVTRTGIRIITLTGWGEWQTANAAITRVTLFNVTAGDNFTAGSRATLYGIG